MKPLLIAFHSGGSPYHKEFIKVPHREGTELVQVKNIYYTETENRLVVLHLRNPETKQFWKLESSLQVSEFEELCKNTSVVRINRSQLVNIRRVKAFLKGGTIALLLKDIISLHLTDEYRAEFQKRLDAFNE